MINKSLIYIFIVSIIFFFSLEVHSQSIHRVMHTKGSKEINGINVTVTHTGEIMTLDGLSYCNGETGPFYFGVDYTHKYGNYTITFHPPVNEVTLNFTGLSAGEGLMEEMQIFINDEHYAIPTIGSKINCEQMAVLTPKGNIRPCINCGVSGWKGTVIAGPIEKLTVADTILLGEPGGVLFALYIGDPVNESKDPFNTINRIKIEDIAAGKGILISSKNFEAANLIFTNKLGEKLTINFYQIDTEHILFTSPLLTKGVYTLEITVGDLVEKQKIIIE